MVRSPERWTALAASALLALAVCPACAHAQTNEASQASLTEFHLSDDSSEDSFELASYGPPGYLESTQSWHTWHGGRALRESLPELLRRSPDSFGDFLSGERIGVQTRTLAPTDRVTLDLPLAGASRRVKVAEHNRALPTDRVYFLYQHFHRALQLERFVVLTGGTAVQGFDVERYTLGVEKTLGSGLWSLEVRVPFTDGFEIADSGLGGAPDFLVTGGDMGNTSFILKRLLYTGELFAVSAGVGLNTPTGSDVQGSVPLLDFPISYVIHNRAYQVLPFVAAVATEGRRIFGHVFLQVDAGANGNRIDAVDSSGQTLSANWNEQTLLYLDGSYGYWLFYDPTATGLLTGLAAMVELHYTTSVQAPDVVPLLGFGNFTGSGFDDVVNGTVGIHAELMGNTSLRVGFVFPFDGRPDRFFDAEVQVSAVRRF